MPTIYVIAGPNGIGKTTSSFDILPGNVPTINSDEIAKEVRAIPLKDLSNIDAVRAFYKNLKNKSDSGKNRDQGK